MQLGQQLVYLVFACVFTLEVCYIRMDYPLHLFMLCWLRIELLHNMACYVAVQDICLCWCNRCHRQ